MKKMINMAANKIKTNICSKCGALMFEIMPVLRSDKPMPSAEKIQAFMDKRHCLHCEKEADMDKQLYGNSE